MHGTEFTGNLLRAPEREAIFQEIAGLTRDTTTAHIPVLWLNYAIAYDKLTGVEESQSRYPMLAGVGVALELVLQGR